MQNAPEQQLEQDNQVLDAEAEALLEELKSSQAEVQKMLALQREQAMELGGLKSALANEASTKALLQLCLSIVHKLLQLYCTSVGCMVAMGLAQLETQKLTLVMLLQLHEMQDEAWKLQVRLLGILPEC